MIEEKQTTCFPGNPLKEEKRRRHKPMGCPVKSPLLLEAYRGRFGHDMLPVTCPHTYSIVHAPGRTRRDSTITGPLHRVCCGGVGGLHQGMQVAQSLASPELPIELPTHLLYTTIRDYLQPAPSVRRAIGKRPPGTTRIACGPAAASPTD